MVFFKSIKYLVILRSKFSPFKRATRGVYRRLRVPADEGKDQSKNDSRHDPDQSQSHDNAARDAYHRLKTSADRRSNRQGDDRLI